MNMGRWWQGEWRPSWSLWKGGRAGAVQRVGTPGSRGAWKAAAGSPCPASGGEFTAEGCEFPGFLAAGPAAPLPTDPDIVDIQGASLLAKMVQGEILTLSWAKS